MNQQLRNWETSPSASFFQTTQAQAVKNVRLQKDEVDHRGKGANAEVPGASRISARVLGFRWNKDRK